MRYGEPYEAHNDDRPAPAESERLIDRGLDALRQVSDLSDEARRLKSVAADVIEDGVHTVKRTAKTLRQDAVDVRDEVTYRVKREPIKALAVAFAVGTLAGLLLGAFQAETDAQSRWPRNGGLRSRMLEGKRRCLIPTGALVACSALGLVFVSTVAARRR